MFGGAARVGATLVVSNAAVIVRWKLVVGVVVGRT